MQVIESGFFLNIHIGTNDTVTQPTVLGRGPMLTVSVPLARLTADIQSLSTRFSLNT